MASGYFVLVATSVMLPRYTHALNLSHIIIHIYSEQIDAIFMSFMEDPETGDHVTHDHPRKNTITYTYTWGKKGTHDQRYTYRVLQTIQMTLILLCVLAERAVLGSAITASKFKCEI